MRIRLLCVGRLGRAPEALLARDYAERASAAGRSQGLGPVEVVEVEARRPGKGAEAEQLLAHLGAGDHLIACDERGRALTSRAFAERIGRLRDDGARRLVLMIGGADGLAPQALSAAKETLAFGPQTWPTPSREPCWPNRCTARRRFWRVRPTTGIDHSESRDWSRVLWRCRCAPSSQPPP